MHPRARRRVHSVHDVLERGVVVRLIPGPVQQHLTILQHLHRGGLRACVPTWRQQRIVAREMHTASLVSDDRTATAPFNSPVWQLPLPTAAQPQPLVREGIGVTASTASTSGPSRTTHGGTRCLQHLTPEQHAQLSLKRPLHVATPTAAARLLRGAGVTKIQFKSGFIVFICKSHAILVRRCSSRRPRWQNGRPQGGGGWRRWQRC